MELLPLEILNLIIEELDMKSILQIQSINHYYYDNVVIRDLFNIDKEYRDRLTDNIIKQGKYQLVTKLNASFNPKITSVSHMTNLQVLHARGNCGIDQKGIKELNLVKLYASYNPKITSVSYMTNLQVLHARGEKCGIDQEGIKGLNLVDLDASENPKITSVAHMINLQVLYAWGSCGIDQEGIKGLNLVKLNASNNKK